MLCFVFLNILPSKIKTCQPHACVYFVLFFFWHLLACAIQISGSQLCSAQALMKKSWQCHCGDKTLATSLSKPSLGGFSTEDDPCLRGEQARPGRGPCRIRVAFSKRAVRNTQICLQRGRTWSPGRRLPWLGLGPPGLLAGCFRECVALSKKFRWGPELTWKLMLTAV